MEKLNMKNIPLNNLYQIGDGRYVWKVLMKETRNGNYPQQEPMEYTEVFGENGNGGLDLVASGRMIINDDVYDYNKVFAVFNYDDDTQYSFDIKGELKPASLEILKKLRETIESMYNRRTR